MLTLTQHIELFRNFATAHSQIKSFAFGEPSMLTETDHSEVTSRLKYPILFMDITEVSVSNNDLRRSYAIYIVDRLDKGSTNHEQVLSNMQLISFDVMAYLKNTPPNWTSVFERSVNMTDLTRAFGDFLAGWLVPITLKDPFLYNTCSIPYNEVPPALNTTCPQVTIYENDGITVHELVNAGGYFIIPTSGGGCSSIDIKNSNDGYNQNILCDQSPFVLPDTTYTINVNGVFNQSVSLPTLGDAVLNINA